MMKLTSEIIRDTVIIFIVSFVIQLSYSVFNRIFYNRFDDSKVIILKYATIVVSSLPLLIMYPFFQKYFDKGIMVGSVKG